EPGIRLRRWLDLGPAVAMECSHGLGAHIDRKEWQVTAEDGEIVLSSRFARAMDFANYRTGVRATLDHSACACGSADPRVGLRVPCCTLQVAGCRLQAATQSLPGKANG